MRTNFNTVFTHELYSTDPSNTVLLNVERELRAALHGSEFALVDDLFISLDVNKLHINMINRIESSTALYSAGLPNRQRFLARAYGAYTRQLKLELNNNAPQQKEIRIDFSDMQADAWVDSCLYGGSYGLLTGEDEHIQAEIEKLGYKKFTHAGLDNKNFQHLVVVDGV